MQGSQRQEETLSSYSTVPVNPNPSVSEGYTCFWYRRLPRDRALERRFLTTTWILSAPPSGVLNCALARELPEAPDENSVTSYSDNKLRSELDADYKLLADMITTSIQNLSSQGYKPDWEVVRVVWQDCNDSIGRKHAAGFTLLDYSLSTTHHPCSQGQADKLQTATSAECMHLPVHIWVKQECTEITQTDATRAALEHIVARFPKPRPIPNTTTDQARS